MPTANFFSALIDPVALLSTCAQSGALNALRVSATRCADRASSTSDADLAFHDAAAEELYQKMISKAAAPVKPKKATHPQAA